MRRNLGREGFGMILAITTLFLLTWSAIGVAQMTFSGSVTQTVHGSTAGAMGVAYAQCAIEEAFHQVSRRVNQPGDPLFEALREEYRDVKKALKTFSIRPDHTFEALGADPLYKGYALAGGAVEVAVIGMRPLTHLTYESKGTLAFTARVSHGSITRTVRQTRGFKVALASTPRPFDQVTWLARHPEPLYGSRAEANRNIDESLRIVKELEEARTQNADHVFRLLERVNEKVKDANENVAKLPPMFSISERAERWLHAQHEQPIREAALSKDPGFKGEDVTAEYHKFPADLILFSVGQELPAISEAFNLQPKVKAQNQAIQESYARYSQESDRLRLLGVRIENKLKEVENFTETAEALGDPDEIRAEARRLFRDSNALRREFSQACDDYAKALSAYSRDHEKRWEIYHQLTRSFLKLSGPKAREVAAHDGKFDVASSPRAHQGRAFVRFTGQAAASRFLQWMADQPAGRPLNGVVFVDNGDEPLKLERLRIHGKLDLAVSGPVDLENVTLGDAANDLFTIHTASRRTVRIAGRVQASVMAAGPVDLAEGAALEGNLVQYSLQMPDRLRGAVRRDGRYFSGVSSTPNQRLDHFVVALSPIPSACMIARR